MRCTPRLGYCWQRSRASRDAAGRATAIDVDAVEVVEVMDAAETTGGAQQGAPVAALIAMGFGRAQAQAALSTAGGNVERAADMLLR